MKKILPYSPWGRIFHLFDCRMEINSLTLMNLSHLILIFDSYRDRYSAMLYNSCLVTCSFVTIMFDKRNLRDPLAVK